MNLLQFLLGFFAYGAVMLGTCGLFMAVGGGIGTFLWMICAAIAHYYLFGMGT